MTQPAHREPALADGTWSVDTIADYIGVTALASGSVLIAGLAYTSAYLSAWRVPLSAIQLDPFTTALRSDAAIYSAVLIAAVAILSRWAILKVQRLTHAPRVVATAMYVAVIAVATAAGFLTYWGVGLAITAGLAIGAGLGHHRMRGWRLAASFALAALLSCYATGYSVGADIRDDESRQTPVTLTTAVPVGGLANGVDRGAAWHYDGLYFVYRDAGAIFVSRTGSGRVAWAVAEFNLRSVGIGGGR